MTPEAMAFCENLKSLFQTKRVIYVHFLQVILPNNLILIFLFEIYALSLALLLLGGQGLLSLCSYYGTDNLKNKSNFGFFIPF